MNELVDLLKADKLPSTFEGVVGNGGGEKAGLKRKREGGGEEGEEDLAGAPPINDIYRSRQQKRVNVV